MKHPATLLWTVLYNNITINNNYFIITINGSYKSITITWSLSLLSWVVLQRKNPPSAITQQDVCFIQPAGRGRPQCDRWGNCCCFVLKLMKLSLSPGAGWGSLCVCAASRPRPGRSTGKKKTLIRLKWRSMVLLICPRVTSSQPIAPCLESLSPAGPPSEGLCSTPPTWFSVSSHGVSQSGTTLRRERTIGQGRDGSFHIYSTADRPPKVNRILFFFFLP